MEALLDLRIRVEDHPTLAVVREADGQGRLELSAPGLAEHASAQPGSQHVELGFGHRALEPEEQPIVEVARVVDAVFIEDERIGEGADLEQAMPVGRVAGQAGDLEAHHQAGPAHAHFRDQMLEAFALDGRGSGLALVAVDDDDLIVSPAQRHGPLTQRVLALGALGVLEHLTQGGLANVEVGGSAEVARGDLLRSLRGHEVTSRAVASAISASSAAICPCRPLGRAGPGCCGARGAGFGIHVEQARIQAAIPSRKNKARPRLHPRAPRITSCRSSS